MILALALNPLASIITGLAISLAGLAIAMAVWRHRRRRFMAFHGPTFHRLCNSLCISRLDRWRLVRLAHKAGLLSPAVLLISRGAFENALVRADIAPETRWIQRFVGRVLRHESAPPAA